MTGRVDNSTPAVVLGCFKHGGVGVTRTLGRLGVPVYCVDADRSTPAFSSKYCERSFQWDLHNASEAEARRFLANLGRSIGQRSVLIPASDIGAMFVAEHAAELREWFLFPDVDAGLVRSLCSKREMYHVARKHGVPAPETAFPRSRADVLEFLETARFPVLVKPIFSYLPGRVVKPMFLVHSAAQLLGEYDANDDDARHNLMLQEFIPGGDDSTYTFNGYFDTHGHCRLAFTGKKLRNFPPDFGQASLGLCMRNDSIQETTIRFMEAIGYRGCLDIGYRFDARDGLFKVNDVNPRVGAMFRLFVGENGMDVARALYLDMTGQSVTPSSTQEGRKWMVEDSDLISSYRYYRRGDLSIGQWWESLRGINELAYLAADDPAPLWPVLVDHAHRARAKIAARRPVSSNRWATTP